MRRDAFLFVAPIAVLLSALMVMRGAAQQVEPPPAVPVEPITAILEAFRSHSVVALGEGSTAANRIRRFGCP